MIVCYSKQEEQAKRMEYNVDAPELGGRTLTVRTGGLFGGDPQLLVDDAPLTGDKGEFVLTSRTGAAVKVRMKTPGLDFVPVLSINGRQVSPAPPLRPWDYLWCGLPALLLTFTGRGVLPGLVGAAFSYLALYLFRTRTGVARYLVSGLVTIAALALIGGFVALAMARHHAPSR